MSTCPACGEENPSRARFCLACGTPLTTAQVRELRKTVTIVFSDVVGSSGLGERLDPEALRQVMTRYYERASAVLSRHGGRVQKFIGDAVMAVFGLPAVREDDALRAVRAAAELHGSLAELNAELGADWGVALNLRTGVNTGEIVVGDAFGGQDIALGDVVNVAARLEQIAEPGEVLLGDATYRLVRDAVTVTMLPPLALRGKVVPVGAWRLLAVKPGAAGHTRRLDAPMVGRSREMALLLQAFDRTVAEHTSHLVTVLGPAGVGKSRLLQELLSRARGQATVMRGQCLNYGEGMTYWPIAEAVRQAAGATSADDPADVRRKVRSLLPPEDQARVSERLGALFGETQAGARMEDLDEALQRLLSVLAAQRPLILVLDDLQWAEGALLDLVERLAGWLRDTPVLLCCLARPELLEIRPGWGGGMVNATTLLLEPLSAEESAALLDNVLDGVEGAEDVRKRLVENAEGNPLYLEELVGMLIDDGVLTRVEGRWETTADLSRLNVPPSVAALLAARLDGLPGGERGVLERASVVGNVFYRGAVIALSPPEDQRGVTERLLSLVRKELIRPDSSTLLGESALRFRHTLVRDAAYNSLSKRERAELHERCANWLEDTLPERVTEVEELVGFHLEQASRYRTGLGPADAATVDLAQRAATHLVASGRRAFQRRDMPAAVNLLTRGAGLLPADSPSRLGVLPDLAAGLVEIGELAQAEAVLSEAVTAAERRGDGALLAAAGRVGAVLHHLREPAAAAPAAPVVTAPTSEGGGRDEATPAFAAGWTLLQDVSWLSRVTGGRERGAATETAAGLSEGSAGWIDTFSMAAVLGATPVAEAVERCTEDLRGLPPNSTAAARARAALAGVTAMTGRFDEAREHLALARATLEEFGLKLRAVALHYLAGFIDLLAGRPADAEEQLRRGREECERMGERYVLANLLALLAQATYVQGRYGEAVTLAQAGEDVAPADEVVAHVTAYGARAKALARLGNEAEARALAGDAVAAVENTGLLNVRADGLLDLAEVLEVVGDTEPAMAAARDALVLYERKGNVVSARRATSVLERLRG